MSETGTATLGIRVERDAAQEDEHHQDDEGDRDHQRDLDVAALSARIVRVASMTTESLTVGGIDAWNCGSSARTPVDRVDDVRARLA